MVEIPAETVATLPDAPQQADWNVTWADVGLDGVGSTFTFTDPDGAEHRAESPLPGMVNVSNAMVAIAAAHAAGVPLDQAIAGVATAVTIGGPAASSYTACRRVRARLLESSAWKTSGGTSARVI